MFDSIPHGAVPIIVGLVAMTMLEILRILSAWKSDAARLHRLKVETHTLRLRLKQQSAARLVEEERHRASFTSHSQAA